MNHTKLSVIYINRRFNQDRLVPPGIHNDFTNPPSIEWEAPDLKQDVEVLTEAFDQVYVCSTGTACLNQLFDVQEGCLIDLRPAMVLIDTPDEERIPEEPPHRSRSPSPLSRPSSCEAEIHTPDEEVYGLRLLQRIMTEAHLRNLSKLVVPILLVGQSGNDQQLDATGSRPFDRRFVLRCLDRGAGDVIIRPMQAKCMMSLEVHAHRVKKDAAREQQTILELRRGRKRSWVGVNEEKPFAYLREAMVSDLMKHICRLSMGEDDRITNAGFAVSRERRAAVAVAIGKWHFCAHDFTDDELLVAALYMFQHALSMPELERWRIPADQLVNFLVACRAAYNSFVPYHNFRHVIDVLQATFNFLVHIGTITPYPVEGGGPPTTKSPVAELLYPFDGLTLLITAIGHDVGHPGVNNGFLVKLNAPLAQLYNDRSVLESFHCAAYSQILRRYWPTAFEDTKMRSLMISSILATDMGLHFDYMKKLGDLQEKLQVDNSTDAWNGRMVEEQRALACSLLIKCADISNVARRHDAALQWTHILADEFSRQASMEAELDIPSSLLAPPNPDPVSLAKSQLGFMNMFALPLFQGVADIMPAMQYTVDELDRNTALFERQVQEARAKEDPVRKRLLRDGTFSPRTMSFAAEPDNQGTSTPQAGTPIPDSGTPSTLTDGNKTVEQELPAPERTAELVEDAVNVPSTSPAAAEAAPEVQANGFVPSFSSVAHFAASDPFGAEEPTVTEQAQAQPQQGQKRCSGVTEDSTPGHCPPDCASQATSATTGKMPISPSTRGTSIVSGESVDRRTSIAKVTASSHDMTTPTHEVSATNGSIGKSEGEMMRSVKKKSSRFRMNNFSFFRRNKTASPTPPVPTNEGVN